MDRRWLTTHGLVVLIVVVAVVVVVVVLLVLFGHWQWGNVPEWFAAVGTVGALSFAAWAYWRDQRERQARLFDAWVARASWDAGAQMTNPDGSVQAGDGLQLVIALSNVSGQAVRGVDVRLVFLDFGERTIGCGVIPPTQPGGAIEKLHGWGLPTGTSQRYPESVVLGGIKISSSFTDAAGNRWHRTDRGKLRFLYSLQDGDD